MATRKKGLWSRLKSSLVPPARPYPSSAPTFEPLEPRLLLSASPAVLNLAAVQQVSIKIEQVETAAGVQQVLTARDLSKTDQQGNVVDKVELAPDGERRDLVIVGLTSDSKLHIEPSEEFGRAIGEIRWGDDALNPAAAAPLPGSDPLRLRFDDVLGVGPGSSHSQLTVESGLPALFRVASSGVGETVLEATTVRGLFSVAFSQPLVSINLVGSAGDDVFRFDTLSGLPDTFKVMGGGGNDTIEVADGADQSWRIALDGSGQVGLEGAQLPAVSFFGISRIASGAGADTLHGPSVDATWRVTGDRAGSIGGIAFQGFDRLQGAADTRDTFLIEPGARIAGVQGGDRGYDVLEVRGGSYDAVTLIATGPDSGYVDLDGNRIAYQGLEPVDVSLSTQVANLTLDLSLNSPNSLNTSSTGHNAVLEDLGTSSDGFMRFRSSDASPTFETHNFVAPTSTLKIKLGLFSDDLTINSLDTKYAFDLAVEGYNSSSSYKDTVVVGGAVVLPGRSISIAADTVTISGTGRIDTRSSTATAGGIKIEGDEISLASGSQLLAGKSAGFAGGAVELISTDANGIAFLGKQKSISIDGATITGNTVSIRSELNTPFNLPLSEYGTAKTTVSISGSTITAENALTIKASNERRRFIDNPLIDVSGKTAEIMIASSTLTSTKDSIAINALATDISVWTDATPGLAGFGYNVGALLNQVPSMLLSKATGITGSVMIRSADAKVSVDNSTLTAGKDVKIGAEANVYTLSQATSVGRAGATAEVGKAPKPSETGAQVAVAFGFSTGAATVEIKGNTTIDAGRDVSVKANLATAKTEVVARTVNNDNTNIDSSTNNSKDVSIAIAIAVTKADALVDVGKDTTILARGGNAEFIAKAKPETSSDAGVVSYLDALAGVTAGISVDIGTARSIVNGKIYARGREPGTTFPSTDVSTTNRSITLSGQQYKTGDVIKYNAERDTGGAVIGTVIPGLVDGSEYYVTVTSYDAATDKQTIQLSKELQLDIDSTGLDSTGVHSLAKVDVLLFQLNSIDFSQRSTDSNSDGKADSGETIRIPGHSFQDGDIVQLDTLNLGRSIQQVVGGVAANLADGTYIVEVLDETSIRLIKPATGGGTYANFAAAQAQGTYVDFADNSQTIGSYRFTKVGNLDAAQAATVADVIEIQFAAVDVATKTFKVAGHGLQTSDIVYYKSLSDESDPDASPAFQLVATDSYYRVERVDADTFKLSSFDLATGDPAVPQAAASEQTPANGSKTSAHIFSVLKTTPDTFTSASVASGSDEIRFAANHGYATGDALLYIGAVEPTVDTANDRIELGKAEYDAFTDGVYRYATAPDAAAAQSAIPGLTSGTDYFVKKVTRLSKTGPQYFIEFYQPVSGAAAGDPGTAGARVLLTDSVGLGLGTHNFVQRESSGGGAFRNVAGATPVVLTIGVASTVVSKAVSNVSFGAIDTASTAETITITGLGFVGAGQVKYERVSGAADIPGLVSGTTYYVEAAAGGVAKFFDLTSGGGKGAQVDLTNANVTGRHSFSVVSLEASGQPKLNASGEVVYDRTVDLDLGYVAGGRIFIAGHGFADGDVIEYRPPAGQPTGLGLTVGQQYTVTGVATDSFALVGATPLAATQAMDQTFSAPVKVRWIQTSLQEVGGLTSGQLYYVVKVSDTAIRLTDDPSEAPRAEPIAFGGTGSGTHAFKGASATAINGINVSAELTAKDTAKSKPETGSMFSATKFKDAFTRADVALNFFSSIKNGFDSATTFTDKNKGKTFADSQKNLAKQANFSQGVGALALVVTEHKSYAKVGESKDSETSLPATLKSGGEISIASKLSQKGQTFAQANSSKEASSGSTTAVAVGVAVYNTDARATVGAGASLDAAGDIAVASELKYPFLYQPLDILTFSDGKGGGPGSDFNSRGAKPITDFLDGTFGFASKLFSSWTIAGSKNKSSAAGDFSASGSLAANVYIMNNLATVKRGAQINQTPQIGFGDPTLPALVAVSDRSVSVTADTTMQLVTVTGTGKFSLNESPIGKKRIEGKNAKEIFGGGELVTLGAKSSGKAAGVGIQFNYIGATTKAIIEAGTVISTSAAGGLTVRATEKVLHVAIAQAGAVVESNNSAGSGGAGSAVAVVHFSDTYAGLESDATGGVVVNGGVASNGAGFTELPAAYIDVSASNALTQVDVAGSLYFGDGSGVGASVALEVIDRDTRAFIGRNADDATGATLAGKSRLTTRSLDLQATNDGGIYSFAVAGVVRNAQTSTGFGQDGKPQAGWLGSGGGGQTPQQKEGGSDAFLSKLSPKASELLGVQKVNGVVTGAEQAGLAVNGRSTFGFAGSVGAHVVFGKSLAYMNDAGTHAIGAANLKALESTDLVAASGAAALNFSGNKDQKGSTSVAVALSFNFTQADTRAFIKGATIHAGTGNFDVKATREGLLLAISAGLAVDTATNDSNSGAGSLSISRFEDKTWAYLENASLVTTGSLALTGTHSGQLISIGGAGAIGGAKGIGASFSFNQIANSTRAFISGGSQTLGGGVAISAKNDNVIQALAVTVGVGTGQNGTSMKVGAAFTVAINVISVDPTIFGTGTEHLIEASIRDNAVTTANTDITLKAQDDSVIQALAGALAVGVKASGIGAGLAWNQVAVRTRAAIDGSTVTSNAGRVKLESVSSEEGGLIDGKIQAAAVGVAVSAGGGASDANAIGISIAVNGITNTIVSEIVNGSTVVSAADTTVSAKDDSTIKALTGGVAISTSAAGAGAAAAANFIANTVRAEIGGDTTSVSSGRNVDVAASERAEIQSITLGLGGGKTVGVGGSVSINVIKNTTSAGISGKATVTADDNVRVFAESTSDFLTIAGGIAGGKDVAVGAAVVNVTAINRTDSYIDGGATVRSKGLGSSSYEDLRGNDRQGVLVLARSNTNIFTLAVSGGVSGSVAVGGSLTLSIIDDRVTAAVRDIDNRPATAGVTADRDDIIVASDGDMGLTGVAGAFAGSGRAAVGVGADVGVATRTVEAYVGRNAKLKAGTGTSLAPRSGSVVVEATGNQDILSISAAGAIAVSADLVAAGVAVTAGVSVLDLTTKAWVGTSAAIEADGTVVVSAEDKTAGDVISGNIAIGTAAGIGIAAGIGVINKTTEAYIGTGANVTGRGNSAETVNTGAIVINQTGQSIVGRSVMFTTANVNLATGTITSTGHGLSDLQEVIFWDDQTGIDKNAKMESGKTYWVIRDSADTFRLASSKSNAIARVAITGLALPDGNVSTDRHAVQEAVTSESMKDRRFTAGNVASNQITIAAHGFATGQQVVYGADDSSKVVGGLTSGERYYVIVDTADRIRLASTQANALAATPIAVNITAAPAGSNHSIGVPRDAAFTSSEVQESNDTIRIVAHGLATGDELAYFTNSRSIGGLDNGQRYYAIKVDDDTIKLAKSKADATAGTNAIELTRSASPSAEHILQAIVDPTTPELNANPFKSDGLTQSRSTAQFERASRRGIAVVAASDNQFVTVGAAVGGGIVGIQIAASVTVHDIKTLAHIDSTAKINKDGNAGANVGQNVLVAAGRSYDQLSLGLGLTLAGVGVTAAVSTPVVKGTTEARITGGSGTAADTFVTARNDIVVAAETYEKILSVGVGVAGGGVAIAGSASAVVIDISTRAKITGAVDAEAGNNVAVTAKAVTETFSTAGAAAIGGTAAIAPAVAVTKIDKKTEATIGPRAVVNALSAGLAMSAIPNGEFNASGDDFATTDMGGVLVGAASSEKLLTVAAALGIGGVGIAGSVGIDLVDSDTLATIGENVTINGATGANAKQSIGVIATNRFEHRLISGNVAAGGSAGVGVGVGLLKNDTKATVESGAILNSRNNVSIEALSLQEIDALTFSGAIGGGGGISGAVTVYNVSGNHTSSYTVNDTQRNNPTSTSENALVLRGENKSDQDVLQFGESVVDEMLAKAQNDEGAKPVTFSSATVDASADTITFAKSTGFKTGDVVTYSGGSGSIGGLGGARPTMPSYVLASRRRRSSWRPRAPMRSTTAAC